KASVITFHHMIQVPNESLKNQRGFFQNIFITPIDILMLKK
ncbi:2237_t:CDS:1, partial [Dentiscutata erythropus]